MSASIDKPWLDGYKLSPFRLEKTMGPYPEVPLFTFFDDTALRYPQRPACLYLGRKITWKELKLYVDKLASALKDLGVEKGDKVATILPTCPQFVIVELLKRTRPFMASLVPTQYMRLIEKKIGRTNTTFSSGAAPLTQSPRWWNSGRVCP